MNYLWKVTANRNFNKVAKGMEVDIVKTGVSAKPSIKEIGEAVRRKYGVEIPNGCNPNYFDYLKK